MVLVNVMPVGKGSETLTAVSAPGLPAGLVSVNVRVVVPPAARLVAAIAFVRVGARYTPRVSEAAVPVRDTGPVAVGASVVFVRVAPVAEVAVIFTCAAQLLPAERLATAR